MNKKVSKNSCIVLTLVLMLLICVNIVSATTSVHTTPFKDIRTTHWGFKDVIKMYTRGIVSGYNDGSFQPGKAVTQIEAILMAVRNMGVQSQLAAINTNQPLPVSVPAWAQSGSKREILFAIEKGLIVPSEKNFNASASATRAWITHLVVRMVNKNSESQQLASEPASFKDAASIPTWALGSVNVGSKYKLISGYPDNTFRPNQYVTRAEIVSLLSKSEEYLNLGEAVITAKVVGISGQTITILINENPKTVSATTQTWIFDDKGQYTDVTGLKKNDLIKIVLNGSIVKYAEILPTEAIFNKIKGTVMQVLQKDKVIVIKDEKQIILTKTLTDNAAVSAQTGQINSLDQVSTGDMVELSLNSADNVVAVQVLNADNITSGSSGVIYEINQGQKLIILKSPAGKFTSYLYLEQALVTIPNVRFPGIKDLQVGDNVKVTVTSGVVTEIELVQAKQQLTVTGKIVLISAEKRILAVETTNSALQAYPIADNVIVAITGLTNPFLSNVLVNDNVEITVEKGIVKAISVKDRNAQSKLMGTVAAIDTSNRILTIRTDKDELKAYEVNTRAEFAFDDRTSSNLSDVKKDMKVQLILVDNKIIYLENKNTVEGTVVSLEQDKHLLTVTGEFNNVSYVLSSSVSVNLQGHSSPDIDDVNKNDYVELMVLDNVVTKINIRKVITYQVTNIYTGSNEIKVKEEDGDTRYLSLGSRVLLVVPGITNPDAEDFAVGNVVKATFMGTKLIKVEVIPANRGQITAVNTFTNTVTVLAFEGTSTTYTFSNKCEVINGGQTTFQISSLVVGDRLEVKEKTAGGTSFSVMNKVNGKFLSYSTSDNKVYIAKDPFNIYNYVMSAKLYVHSGIQSLSLRNLLKDDTVDAYVLDSIVYEIERR